MECLIASGQHQSAGQEAAGCLQSSFPRGVGEKIFLAQWIVCLWHNLETNQSSFLLL